MEMSRPRFKIGWFMVATVFIAIVLGVMKSPLDPLPMILFLAPLWIFFAFCLYIVLIVVPYTVFVSRKACPSCGYRSMECRRVGLWPPLSSWHRCRSCEATTGHRFGVGWGGER